MDKKLSKAEKNRAKSCTNLIENIETQQIQNYYKLKKKLSVYEEQFRLNKEILVYNAIVLNHSPYITCEKFHNLNKPNSDTYVVRSTSTMFYDLDQMTKRKPISKTKDKILFNSINYNTNDNGYKAKSEAIVKVKVCDEKELCFKRNKESSTSDKHLNIIINKNEEKYIENNFSNNHQQHIWSLAKYRTEYTNPKKNGKKSKNKEHGKRIDDPCPCQLFSYACPCSDEKSLTKLAKNSISLTVIDKITSTDKGTDIKKEDKANKEKKANSTPNNVNKMTSTNLIELSNEYEINISDNSKDVIMNKKDIYSLKNDNKKKLRLHKKEKHIICPYCKEIVNIKSTPEKIDSFESNVSPRFHYHQISSTIKEAKSPTKPLKTQSIEDRESCNHSPPCELVPICQMLHSDVDSNYMKHTKRKVAPTTPRSIRITKACRHHPPCTVVPSCQRLNVLKNNCEYIPPCLHQPRCINIPLCIPPSKQLDYTIIDNHSISESNCFECKYIPQCKYKPLHQNDSFNNSTNPNFLVKQNTCDYLSACVPRLILNPNLACVSPTFSPYQVPTSIPCKYSRSTKSCQYDCADCKYNTIENMKSSISSEAIIFIRDVGCQFQNKNISTKGSLNFSNGSNNLMNFAQRNTGSYITNINTLRCEDKYTHPISGEDLSMSTVSTSSLDIDEYCPSHGKHAKQSNRKNSAKGPIKRLSKNPHV